PDLAEFETRIEIRPLQVGEADAIIELQKKCFPGMPTWSQAHIESQCRTFPDGQIGVIYEGELVASSASLIVDFDHYEAWHDWRVIADGGFIRNHDEEGDTLYGIEIMVDPEYRGLKLARRLYN